MISATSSALGPSLPSWALAPIHLCISLLYVFFQSFGCVFFFAAEIRLYIQFYILYFYLTLSITMLNLPRLLATALFLAVLYMLLAGSR